MKNYTEFLNERKRYKLTSKDNQELGDFLNHVLNDMEEEPTLLRSAYARIQGILKEIRSGNCPKNKLVSFFQTIFLFIEGKRRADEVKEWSEKLMQIDIDSYDTLLSIIHEYNHLVHKFKNEDFNNQVWNIKAWIFEPEGIRAVSESSDTDDEIQKLFMDQELSWEEKQKLKNKLPRITSKEISGGATDDREWKVGDIAFSDGKHYLVVESYEDYCDFGCGYIATYLAENPDIDEDEFGEYVTQHNKADRDIGELQDVCKEEIERLGKEFKKK